MKTLFGIALLIALLIGVGTVAQDKFNQLEAKISTQAQLIDAEKEAPQFGAVQTVGGKPYYLYGSGMGASDVSMTLTSFTQPVNNYKLAMADFGTIGYLTIEPGNTTRQEFVSFTGVSQNADGTATLTGLSRGLAFVSPYTASSTLQKAHGGGSTVIISNPPQLYSEVAFKKNNEWITGTWGFGANVPTTTAPCTVAGQLCNYESLVALSLNGAATSTETILGLSVITPTSVVGSSTASTTPGLFGGAPYVLLNKFATTTPGTLCTSNVWKCIVATNAGKIAQAWLDLTAAFTWTGQHIFNSTGAGTGIFATNASSTNATTTTTWALGSTNMRVPQSAPAASSSIIALSGASPYQMSFVQQGAVLAAGSPLAQSGTSATTTLWTITIPANTLNASTTLRVSSVWDATPSGNDCRAEIVFGTGLSSSTIVYFPNLPAMTYSIITSTSTSAEYSQSYSTTMGNPNTLAVSGAIRVHTKNMAFSQAAPLYIGFAEGETSGTCILSSISAEVLYQR